MVTLFGQLVILNNKINNEIVVTKVLFCSLNEGQYKNSQIDFNSHEACCAVFAVPILQRVASLDFFYSHYKAFNSKLIRNHCVGKKRSGPSVIRSFVSIQVMTSSHSRTTPVPSLKRRGTSNLLPTQISNLQSHFLFIIYHLSFFFARFLPTSNSSNTLQQV